MSTVSASPPAGGVSNADVSRLDGASRFRIFAILAVIVLYTEVMPTQYVMVAAALQKMSKSFPGVGANLNWAIIILGLVGASATPLLGKMSDVWGKKRMFLVCGALFIAGALIDAMTTNWALFMIGRGLQAFSVAMQIISYGLIRDLMPRKYVPLGLGITAAGLGFSGILGPVVGGFLVDHFDWQAMFWVLAVYTLVMTPIVMFVIPESKVRIKQRIDPFGAVLLSAGALLTLLYLDKGQDWGWGRPATLAWLIGGLLLLALFFVVEIRVSQPIVNMKLLLNPRVSLVMVMTFFGVGITALQSYATGYLTQTPSAGQLKDTVTQGVIAQAHQAAGVTLPASAIHVHFNPGYSYGNGFGMLSYAMHLGVWAGAAGMIFGPLAGIMARRMGGRIPAAIGFGVMAVLGVVYALVIPHYSWQLFLIMSLLFGLGFGFSGAAAPILMVEAVPHEQQGVSLGMLGVMQSMSSGIMLAVVTALLNGSPVKAHISVMGHSVTQVIPQVFADHGYVVGFWIAAGAALLATILALVMRHGRKPATGGADPLTDVEHSPTEALAG